MHAPPRTAAPAAVWPLQPQTNTQQAPTARARPRAGAGAGAAQVPLGRPSTHKAPAAADTHIASLHSAALDQHSSSSNSQAQPGVSIATAAAAVSCEMQQQAAQRAPHCCPGHPAAPWGARQQHSRARRRLATPVAAPDAASTSGRALDYAPTPQPASPGFLQPDLPPVEPWVRPEVPTYTQPSVRDSGTLRPQAEWYPAWMRYRRREDNYVFWQDKFSRCSLDIPAIEKRWTVFSTFWYLVLEFKYFAVPPAVRYLFYLAWRSLLQAAYNAHKALVLWQAKVDAGLASRATGGAVCAFSIAMALRRLHWRNSLLGELLYAINVYKTGRVHMLPPVKKPFRRPTFFFLF